ncbi:MAG: ribosome assembly cofactor RimP [Paludibacteraceae bacterium]|jgi:ribosome maturation factor RimP|nr:ribosome assembly cofactor RimP [Bacteroidales bacterium]MBP3467734.1 ribosome assembly cofactor RimP [Paludibacteraceae bacterium]MBQ1835704.1 ribosome assembly cofactor RimP [Paludibacteraceae bacterium]MBQ2591519.1 ribosome assembly cofactor RimP [Paludibacteraceae bacterium]MBQ3680329.1 ribosome assembly cofactor RimP [Paludibacteraceae bacterium]
MIDIEKLREFCEAYIKDRGYFLTDLTISKDNDIVVEIDNMDGVDLDFCANMTRAIEGEFDREKEDYSLEVGSAGLSSPFKVAMQYVKNIGTEVETLTKGGEKLKGTLKSANEDSFVITIETKEKPEGAKKKIVVEKDIDLKYTDVKYTKSIIKI